MNFLNKRNKRVAIVSLLSLLSLVCAVAGSYLATGTYSKILTFNLVPFYLDYQEIGFIRRGLTGSLLYALDMQNSDAILFISYGWILVAAILFWSWIVSYEGDSDQATKRYAVFILSPALFLHFGFDLGRCDPLNLIFFITGLYLIKKNYYALSGITASLGILNHESFLFAYLPVMLALFLFRSSEKNIHKRNLQIALLLLPAVVTNVAITLFSGNNVDMDAVNNMLGRHLDAGGAQYYFIKFTSIRENIITSALNFYGSLKINLFNMIFLVIYMSVFSFYIFKFIEFNRDNKKIFFWISCFSPLLLLLVAIDKGRWFSMLAFNLCLISSFLYDPSAIQIKKPSKIMPATVIILGLILGPMTISGFYMASKFENYFKEPKRIFQTK